ncbi:hypothetical protein QBE52_04035 [Clostridiaceae bacterium 35-E11]
MRMEECNVSGRNSEGNKVAVLIHKALKIEKNIQNLGVRSPKKS